MLWLWRVFKYRLTRGLVRCVGVQDSLQDMGLRKFSKKFLTLDTITETTYLLQTCRNSSSLLVKCLSSLLYPANRLMEVQAVSLDLCIALIRNRIIWAKWSVCLCFVANNSQSILAWEHRNSRTCKNIKLPCCMVNNRHFVFQFQNNYTLSLSKGQRLLHSQFSRWGWVKYISQKYFFV